ncbi:MAG: glutamate synthase large subunit [SAR202 cluster bacterium]|nr:glutamate synthase large subunit [SAR202 cluster bacterium]
MTKRSKRSLYEPSVEHDSCGMGFVADIGGGQSHTILQHALTSLANLAHRGGVDAVTSTSDGAGVLTQLPKEFFAQEAECLGQRAVPRGDLAVAVVFLPGGGAAVQRRERCRSIIESASAARGLAMVGWRDVPSDPAVLGARARKTMPSIAQLLVARPERMAIPLFRQELFAARKEAERRLLEGGLDDCYIPSLSNDTIVYKGLLAAGQLRGFYPDLRDQRYATAYAVFHQRFSTNTFPSWFLAQPFRLLAHNGEINTIRGNQSWVRAREPGLKSGIWRERVSEMTPILQQGGSDSTHLDNMTEALVMGGRDILQAMTMLVPEAWEQAPRMDQGLRDYYGYNACLTEPWDGPAALAFAAGGIVGARLDRNGLRPARYAITDGGLVIAASEVGILEMDEAEVIEKGRLGPGQMIAVDVANKRLLRNDAIKADVSRRKPYGAWLRKHLVNFGEAPMQRVMETNGHSPDADLRLAIAFNYTAEEMQFILKPMANGEEPTGSLGDDTPLAVLSSWPRLPYAYLKQRFAQVTNPAIDPLREQLVMSLYTYLGTRGSILEETERSAHLLRLDSPLLTDRDLDALRGMSDPAFRTATLSAVFPTEAGPSGLEAALTDLCLRAERAVGDGRSLLIISDRAADARNVPIPMLLAVGAVHQHLIHAGLRMRASIIADTGDARDMHQLTALIGYGASAANPYLACRLIPQLMSHREEHLSAEEAVANYRAGLEKQLLKVMAKMGISTVTAYCGAQLFDVIGLSDEVVERCFTGSYSHVGGLGFAELAQEAIERHAAAFSTEQANASLADHGYYRLRRSGELHSFTPQLARLLHTALRQPGDGATAYGKYSTEMSSRGPIYLRDLLTYRLLAAPIPVEEVEPAKDIVKRLSGGSMSFGSLGIEAHETIATAFNRVGSKSGSGEGGEGEHRYGSDSNSRIKQVASARFGVTPAYLTSAEVLEIKMAQGSKPGEGGQLPGHKVSQAIASVRLTQPGIRLISPPPHHDIYSIEDLAQLIFDLRMVNPKARIMVKLVSEAGVGTVAAGVAKAGADAILISGMEGGTGASPWSSIKNAGIPWELGLTEAHQALVANGHRSTVLLRTDGGLRTGRDVVIAAMLGAEEYGFGTASLVAVGCLISRQCHLNTCPVGIATQDPELRKKFDGTPEMLVRFLFHVAEEVRQVLASLGARSIQEIVGRSDLLEQVRHTALPKANTLDLSSILLQPSPGGPRQQPGDRQARPVTPVLEDALLPSVRPAIDGHSSVDIAMPIHNTDRAVGARIAGEIARALGNAGLADMQIQLQFHGSAGQSFGAFCINGLSLSLTGEANDYVGKGMCGGQIVVRPSHRAKFAPNENVIMGNTVLYGATGGRLFASGRAGERFAVRNSGAHAVVEGTGDHCCEYMTGGTVVVLGPTGRNFGAGMSGGQAYVLDPGGRFAGFYNPEMVGVQRLRESESGPLRDLIARHRDATGSPLAADILARWEHYLPLFWEVAPKVQPAKKVAPKQRPAVPAGD